MIKKCPRFRSSFSKRKTTPSSSSSSISSSTASDVSAEATSTLAMQALEVFMDILNRKSYTELLLLCERAGDIWFEDATMGVQEYVEEMVRCSRVFPDLQFDYESIECNGQDQAIIKGLRVSGTHQGPYGFGPYPEIPATQIKCQNDPEDVFLWIDPADGKITKVKFIAKGKLTGPPGFYQQIGGVIF